MKQNFQEQRRIERRVEILSWIFSVGVIAVMIFGILRLIEIVKANF